MKKEVWIVILLLCIFIQSVGAQPVTVEDPNVSPTDDPFSDDFGDGFSGAVENGQTLTKDTAGLKAGSEFGEGNAENNNNIVTADAMNHGETASGINFNSVKEVTVNEDGSFEADSASQLTTEGNVLSNANNVEVDSDGNINAGFINTFSFQDNVGGTQLEGVRIEKPTNLITILKGNNLHFEKPYPITFKKVGPSTFKVTEEGALMRWSITFPENNYAYTWKNPLSLKKPNQRPLIGSATLAAKDPFIITDEFMQARGYEEEVWTGNNENYTENIFSSITFEIEKNSSFTIGSKEAIFEATVLDDLLVSALTVQKSDEESYLVSSFNIVAYFYGEEFIERARALTLSFRLDINEGFYSHLLLSPGDYRFTFRNLKKYKDIFALKASKHWAQSFQIDTENDLYDIAIDKEERRSSLEEYYNLYTGNQNSGYLSLFHEKLFILKGLFNYKRKGFSIGGQEIKSGGITFYDFKDPEKKYYPIIESQDPNNVVNLKFAQDNPVFVEATIDGNYKAHFEDALVYEINQKQFYGWESVGTPPVLVKLTSSHEPIYVDNSIERGKRVLVTGNTRFFSEQDSSQEVFLRTMYEYEQDFEFCVDKVRPAYFENKDQYTIMDWMKE